MWKSQTRFETITVNYKWSKTFCLCNCDSLLRLAFACGPASLTVLTVCLPPQKSLEVTKDLFSLNPTVNLLLMLRRCKTQGDLSLPLWLAYTNVYTKKTTEN